MKGQVIIRKFSVHLLLLSLSILPVTPATPRPKQTPSSPAYWPTDGWRSTTPEQQGIDSDKLADVLDYIRKNEIKIHSLLIVRNGFVVLDAYFYPYNENDVHDLASVTKSVTATLVGVAINQGKIKSVQQPLLALFPARPVLNRDARKENLTLENLLTMSSGLNCRYESGEPTLREMRQSSDWIQFMLNLPMAAESGRKFVYCSGGMHLLSGVISQTTNTNALDFARKSLFEPLGIRDAVWPSDAQGLSFGWGDLHLHPRDMAKLGYLYLNRGSWGGKQILNPDWVAQATQVHAKTGLDADYGYGWWVFTGKRVGQYEAVGRGGQRISLIPEKNIVTVFTGGGFNVSEVGNLLAAALKSDQPLPANPGGVARLSKAVAVASTPPMPRPAPPLPEMARAVSGKKYLLEENPLSLKTIALTFTSQSEATVRLAFADNHEEVRPIGLDGVLRVSSNGRFGLPVGVKGVWETDSIFVLNYDEIANINSYQFRLSFKGKRVTIQATERTDKSEVRIEGKRSLADKESQTSYSMGAA
jgi:CubicO group peptidase (beta-lactamase class C family)